MATVFWDSQGIILIDYLQKDKTITREYYATLLNRLKEELKKKTAKIGAQKNALPRQRAVPQVDRCNGKTRIEL